MVLREVVHCFSLLLLLLLLLVVHVHLLAYGYPRVYLSICSWWLSVAWDVSHAFPVHVAGFIVTL